MARPIEKKIEVPVVEVARKAKKVSNSDKQRRPEPVQMVEQTSTMLPSTSSSKNAKEEKLVQEVDVPAETASVAPKKK